MNRLWQTGQMKFFSPVWVRVWRASSSERAKRFPQPDQLHGKGRSPRRRRTRRKRRIRKTEIIRLGRLDFYVWGKNIFKGFFLDYFCLILYLTDGTFGVPILVNVTY